VEKEIWLNDGDVVHINPSFNFAEVPTSKIKDIKKALANVLQSRHSWASDGVKCEILQSGGEWTTGTIRLQMVFEPDISNTEDAPLQATQAIFVQYGGINVP
jgi:hypothetical protein